MATDIRISIGFKGHRKRKRLQRLLGHGYLDYLIDLWITVANDRPKGILTDWDEIDIADACGWEKEPKTIVNALLKAKWIDNVDGVYHIHDWEEHQGWVFNSDERRKSAKKAADARWNKKRNNTKVCGPHAEGMRSLKIRNAPSPSPSPSPKPLPSPNKKTADKIYKEYLDIVAPQKKTKQRALKNIDHWLKKGRTDGDLVKAIKNYAIECSPDPQYCKDPANFFGITEDFCFDYLPDNFTPPKKQSLAQKAF